MSVNAHLDALLKTDVRILAIIPYGSRLYGTDISTSDYDYKGVYLPSIDDLLLAKKIDELKWRFTADGEKLGINDTMTSNGWEAQMCPVQVFVEHFRTGQAYAVELAFAVKQGIYLYADDLFIELCGYLCSTGLHKNVNGMVGFAMKQTMDYVHRGERYQKALNVLDSVNYVENVFTPGTAVRLDTVYENKGPCQLKVIDKLAEMAGLEMGTSENNNKIFRTLKLNGREYLETTGLLHFKNAVNKLIDEYGERSKKAAKTEVDWKSLSHAVRVYEQVQEILEFGTMDLPRKNADFLRQIRNAQISIEDITQIIKDHDERTQYLLSKSDLESPSKENYNRILLGSFLNYWYDRN